MRSTDAVRTPRDDDDRVYPCMTCKKLRSKNEGGTTFTVCDKCWDKPPAQTAAAYNVNATQREARRS